MPSKGRFSGVSSSDGSAPALTAPRQRGFSQRDLRRGHDINGRTNASAGEAALPPPRHWRVLVDGLEGVPEVVGRDLARGVHKLDLPCKDVDSAATADVTAYGTDHAEKLRG
jgi:hypothetical protein